MKNTIILLIAASAMPINAQNRGSSFTITVQPKAPLFQTHQASLRGEYTVVNDHSNQAMSTQTIGQRQVLAQLEDDSTVWTFKPTAAGRYKIGTADGLLADDSDYSQIQLTAEGTEWDVLAIDGAQTYLIRGISGRVLENDDWRALSGNWITAAAQTGGANQEWIIRAPGEDKSVMLSAPNPTMNVRHGSRRIAVPSAASWARPKLSWSADGYSYLYRIRIDDKSLHQIRIAKSSDLDAAEVAAPVGWQFIGITHSWIADGDAAKSGEFVMRSSWAPGPVIVEARAESTQSDFDVEEDSTAARAAMRAYSNRGSQYWAIGPAIPPQTTDASMRDLARSWVNDGLAFAAPLLDASRPISDIVASLRPRTPFERELVSVLKTLRITP